MTRTRANFAAVCRTLLLISAVFALHGCHESSRKELSPKRIVLIVIDTLRADQLGCYGSSNRTPEIDRLARGGRRFDNVVSSFHQTTMSVAALFTGRTPSVSSGSIGKPLPWNGKTWCGFSRFAKGLDDTCIPRHLPTLAATLRDAGYWTMGVVANQLLFEPAGYARGFEDWVEVGPAVSWTKQTAEVAEARAAAYVNMAVRKVLARRPRDDFFLYVHFMDVHDYSLLDRSYVRSVELADGAIGKLLRTLRGERLLDDALVVFTSDHGERLGETHALKGLPGHLGNPSFDAVLRVPLIIWPALISASDQLVRSEDMAEMILTRAGLPFDRDRDLARNEVLLTEQRYVTLRKFPWKATLRRSDANLFLFDLAADPGETRDMATERPAIAGTMRSRILTLSDKLVAQAAGQSVLSPEDRERLRVLGYLKEQEPH